MRLVFENAEEKAVKYLKLLNQGKVNCGVALFSVEGGIYAQKGRRSEVKQIVERHLPDPKAHLFQFRDGNLLIFSNDMSQHHAFHISRDLNMTKAEQVKVYKAIRDKDYILELIKNQMLKETKVTSDIQSKPQMIKDQFKGVPLPVELQDVIKKKRDGRDNVSVLVIDDDQFVAQLMHKIVGPDYFVDTAKAAVEGLKKYAHQAPDIVFLDINMPNISGYDFLERIFDLDPEAYIVMISGNSDHKSSCQAQELGAKGYIQKPFSQDEIASHISQCRH